MNYRDWFDELDRQDWSTNPSGTVRFALVGLGWWTTDVVLPALESSDICETTVLVSSSEEKAQDYVDDSAADVALTYDAFHEGRASETYDAVYVATPNAYHLDYVETASELGKAVIVEKPMEASMERASRLVDVAESNDIPLMVAYRMHTDPVVRRARELVDDGFLGDPVHVYGTNSQRLLEINPNHDQWRLDSDASGYGTSVMDLGIYPLNTARFLLRRDPIEARAEMVSVHEAFSDVPDERASFVLRFEDDVQMACTTSQNGLEDTELTLVGTDGRIELSPAFHGDCHLHLTRDGVSMSLEMESLDVEREMREEFEYFADHVLSGRSIDADGRHGLVDLRAIEAIHKSARTGSVVRIRE
ncbi:D-xylose 1-dehydrogenase Gfo6 [Halomicrococcus sp. NG-SE-24]|uniref:D-xylose 1-dehydrogenase Gfo6 n=1 Tax=Halomicrococcus sp. NG-SE-24 TaxID=3436928 RepID=UPI003D98F813